MGKELVVQSLPDHLRVTAALSDIVHISDAARLQHEIDAYAESQYRTMLIETSLALEGSPHIAWLQKVQELAGINSDEEGAALDIVLDQRIRNPDASYLAPLVDDQLLSSLHPDHSAGAGSALADISGLLAVHSALQRDHLATRHPTIVDDHIVHGGRVVSTGRAVSRTIAEHSIVAAHAIGSNPKRLELLRWQAWLGLSQGRTTRFSSRAEVDGSIEKERAIHEADIPLTLLRGMLNTAFHVAGGPNLANVYYDQRPATRSLFISAAAELRQINHADLVGLDLSSLDLDWLRRDSGDTLEDCIKEYANQKDRNGYVRFGRTDTLLLGYVISEVTKNLQMITDVLRESRIGSEQRAEKPQKRFGAFVLQAAGYSFPE